MDATIDYRFVLGPHGPLALPLQRLLSRNRALLREVAAEFPAPRMHREVLGDLLERPAAQRTGDEAHRAYLTEVLEHDDTQRIIYTYDAFFGSRKNALNHDGFYPSLELKLAPLREMTLGHAPTIFLCLSHFTKFMQAELHISPQYHQRIKEYPTAFSFSWLAFIDRLKDVWPEATIVLLNADRLAVNWALAVSLITGHPNAHAFTGLEKFPASQLTDTGRKQYLKTLKTSPSETAAAWTHQTSAAFERNGSYSDILEKVIASPWSDAQTQFSKDTFAADIAGVRNMENVILSHELDWDTS